MNIEALAKEYGVDESGLKCLMRYLMMQLEQAKHLEMFMADPSAWLEAGIQAWYKNSQKFYEQYFNDEDFRQKVNEETYRQLREE